MKFLLVAVNAKYIHSNPALYSLKAYASKYSDHIEIAEYTINNRMEDILAGIYEHKPDAIGISCYIWNWNIIRELMVELNKIMPDVSIWLGGPEVSYDAKIVMEAFPAVTGIMIGEGEATFLELMKHYVEGNLPLNQILGIVYRDQKICQTGQRALTELGELPFLYDNLEEFENRIIYYESSRGCPFKCSYCLSSIDKQVRLRDIRIVEKELQYFLDNNVKQVKFIDRTFNCNHKHAMAIWKYIKENDNGITNFHFEISADIMNEEEITLLNSFRSGLAQLEIGVQSANSETIKAINRSMNLECLKDIVGKIKSGFNIHQHLDLIVGLPYEDFESFKYSFNVVYDMEPEQLQLGFLKVLKGSLMMERATEYGIKYLSNPPYEVLSTNWITYEEVLKLKKIEEMVELYYNSGQFSNTLKVLVREFTSPFDMYEKMAHFYEENNYYKNIPARVYRYDVLLKFAAETNIQKYDLFRELLTFDMYLRENMKSRPEFAPDISNFKEEIVAFYKEEALVKRYLKDEFYDGCNGKQLSKMTHAEIFNYHVWEPEKSYACERGNQPCIVIFDYHNRNPLNSEALTYVVI